MITYYERLQDGTIGISTTNKELANKLGLKHTTEKEIVYGKNNKRYFKDNEPATSKYKKYITEINDLKAQLKETDWISTKLLDAFVRNDSAYETLRIKYLPQLEERESYRAKINILEEKINKLTATYLCYKTEDCLYYLKNNTVTIYTMCINLIQNMKDLIENTALRVASVTDTKIKIIDTTKDSDTNEIIAIRDKTQDIY